LTMARKEAWRVGVAAPAGAAGAASTETPRSSADHRLSTMTVS
jgi:hypothetical protein